MRSRQGRERGEAGPDRPCRHLWRIDGVGLECWIPDQFEFPYQVVFPQELDAGNLNANYDVLIFQSDVLGREGAWRRGGRPARGDLPAEFRPMLGTIMTETRPSRRSTAFAKAGGTVIADRQRHHARDGKVGLPVTNMLTTTGKDGQGAADLGHANSISPARS